MKKIIVRLIFVWTLFSALTGATFADSVDHELARDKLSQDLTAVRQIVSAYKLAQLLDAEHPAPAIAIGNFKKVAFIRYDAERFKAQFDAVNGVIQGRIMGVLGDLDVKWVSAGEVNAHGYFAALDEKLVRRSAITPTLMAEEFTTVFVVPEKIDYKYNPSGLMAGTLEVYEIPLPWSKGVMNSLTRLPTSDSGSLDSQFGNIRHLLGVLRALEASPEALDQALEMRKKLLDLLRDRKNDRAVEVLFYGAIASSGMEAIKAVYWEGLMAALKSGGLSKASAARIFLALVFYDKLEASKRAELVALIKPAAMVGNEGNYNHAKLSIEEQQVATMLNFYINMDK